MVELKVDAKNWESYSRDYYLSVRVGDTQKLSRIGASRTFKFPSPSVGNRRYGKIEILRRVGTSPICIDASSVGSTYEVPVAFEGNQLCFGVSFPSEATGSTPVPSKAPAVPDKPNSVAAKVAAAKEYLEEHHLELRLSEAMQEVLRLRPKDPAKHMADFLIKSREMVANLPNKLSQKVPAAGNADHHTQPSPALANASPPRQMPSESACRTSGQPPRETQQVIAQVSCTQSQHSARQPSMEPFREYYKRFLLTSTTTRLEGLFAKFPSEHAVGLTPEVGDAPDRGARRPGKAHSPPSQPRKALHHPLAAPPFREYYKTFVMTSAMPGMGDLLAKFPSKQPTGMTKASPLEGLPLERKASVATWFLHKPKHGVLPSQAEEQDSSGEKLPFQRSASVATWIMFKPRPQEERESPMVMASVRLGPLPQGVNAFR